MRLLKCWTLRHTTVLCASTADPASPNEGVVAGAGGAKPASGTVRGRRRGRVAAAGQAKRRLQRRLHECQAEGGSDGRTGRQRAAARRWRAGQAVDAGSFDEEAPPRKKTLTSIIIGQGNVACIFAAVLRLCLSCTHPSLLSAGALSLLSQRGRWCCSVLPLTDPQLASLCSPVAVKGTAVLWQQTNRSEINKQIGINNRIGGTVECTPGVAMPPTCLEQPKLHAFASSASTITSHNKRLRRACLLRSPPTRAAKQIWQKSNADTVTEKSVYRGRRGQRRFLRAAWLHNYVRSGNSILVLSWRHLCVGCMPVVLQTTAGNLSLGPL